MYIYKISNSFKKNIWYFESLYLSLIALYTHTLLLILNTNIIQHNQNQSYYSDFNGIHFIYN